MINRVSASVKPTNHVKRGIRQVAFPYELYKMCYDINVSVGHELEQKIKMNLDGIGWRIN